MTHLEDELRNALKHKETPPGFAGRLVKRIRAETSATKSWGERYTSIFRHPRTAWCVGVAAVILSIVIGITQYRSYQRGQLEGEQVKTQLMLALKIAGNKLSLAQRRVLEMQNRHLSSEPTEER
jgi:hypothetical protein